MFRIAFICGLVAVLFGVMAIADPPSNQSDAGVVTIPLDQIWAYDMPGTRDLRALDSEISAKQVEGIRRELSTAPPTGKKAASAFSVIGGDSESLHEAHAVLVEGKKPRKVFLQGSDISVVFFSYQFDQYVQLKNVERDGDVVIIQYQFVPHKSKQLTEHFALIPLGKLDAGTIRVEIVQSPMQREYVDAGFKPINSDAASRVVCNSFSIAVVERDSD